MTIDKISNWIEKFEQEYCAKKRIIRGRQFSGAKIEIHPGRSDGWDCLEVHLTGPMPFQEGTTEDRLIDVIMCQNEYVFVHLSFDEFEKVLKNEYQIPDDRWIWDDEV